MVLILEITVAIAWVLVQTDQSMCPRIHLCFIIDLFAMHTHHAESCRPIAGEADERLFSAVISHPTHVLRKHLPEVTQLSYNLRPLPHGFLLPSKDDRNFLSRLLYKDM